MLQLTNKIANAYKNFMQQKQTTSDWINICITSQNIGILLIILIKRPFQMLQCQKSLNVYCTYYNIALIL